MEQADQPSSVDGTIKQTGSGRSQQRSPAETGKCCEQKAEEIATS